MTNETETLQEVQHEDNQEGGTHNEANADKSEDWFKEWATVLF